MNIHIYFVLLVKNQKRLVMLRNWCQWKTHPHYWGQKVVLSRQPWFWKKYLNEQFFLYFKAKWKHRISYAENGGRRIPKIERTWVYRPIITLSPTLRLQGTLSWRGAYRVFVLDVCSDSRNRCQSTTKIPAMSANIGKFTRAGMIGGR